MLQPEMLSRNIYDGIVMGSFQYDRFLLVFQEVGLVKSPYMENSLVVYDWSEATERALFWGRPSPDLILERSSSKSSAWVWLTR